jgi:hypothetical protein
MGGVRTYTALALVCASTLAAAGCNKDAPPPPAAEPAPAANAPASSAAPPAAAAPAPTPAPVAALAPPPGPKLNPADLSWEYPKGWEKAADNPMRYATYKVPAAKGDKEGGELAVYYFPPHLGGATDAIVNRWIGQFKGVDISKVKRSERKVADTEQHFLEIPSGTYDIGAASFNAEKLVDNYGLLAAVVIAPSGKYIFKLTGPKATVKGANKTFMKMLENVKVKTPTPAASSTPSPAASPTPSPAASPTPSPAASPTPSPAASPTPSPAASPTPS